MRTYLWQNVAMGAAAAMWTAASCCFAADWVNTGAVNLLCGFVLLGGVMFDMQMSRQQRRQAGR